MCACAYLFPLTPLFFLSLSLSAIIFLVFPNKNVTHRELMYVSVMDTFADVVHCFNLESKIVVEGRFSDYYHAHLEHIVGTNFNNIKWGPCKQVIYRGGFLTGDGKVVSDGNETEEEGFLVDNNTSSFGMLL